MKKISPRATSIITTLKATPQVLHEYLLDHSVYRITIMFMSKDVRVMAYVLRGNESSVAVSGPDLMAAYIELVKKLDMIPDV